MKIVITGMGGAEPIVLDGLKSVLFACEDGGNDWAAPCIAHGEKRALAQLAGVILAAVRMKLGDDAFRAAVKSAQAVALSQMTDVTDAACETEP